jgi:Protein of unknown function (DUF3352)
MSLHRLAPLALLVLALTLAAGCGGGSTTEAGSGAAVVPASAPFYASLSTDPEGGQWKQASALLKQVSGGDEMLRSMFEEEGGWEAIEPALGPELVMVVLDASSDSSEIALTQPDDVEAFKKLSAEDDSVTREIDGWWAVADSEALLDRFEQAKEDGTLADSEAFQQATSELPDDPLATLYVSPASEIGSLPGMLDEGTLRCFAGGDEQQASAFAISAVEGGFRLDSSETTAPFPLETGASDLDDKLPAGAMAFASVHKVSAVLSHFLDCAGDSLGMQLGQLEAFTGISPEKDLLPLFQGETALAVYPPTGNGTDPGIAAVTQVDDTADVLASFDRHLQALGPLIGELTVREQTLEGLDVHVVISDGRPVFAYAARDGLFAVSNTPAGTLVLQGGGKTLAQDEHYLAARDAAGAPDETAGFLYVDAAALGSLFTGTGMNGAQGLGGLVVWGESDGDALSTQGFLAID